MKLRTALFALLVLIASGCGDKDGHNNCKSTGCPPPELCVFFSGAAEPVCAPQCGAGCVPPACLCAATCRDCKDCAMVCPLPPN